MKSFLSLFIIFVVFNVNYVSANIVPGLNYCKLVHPGLGQNITFTDPLAGLPVTKFAGELVGYVNRSFFPTAPEKVFYSLDLDEDPSFQDSSYRDSELEMDQRVVSIFFVWEQILNIPYDSNTTASIQVAIWHYKNLLNPMTITDSIVRTRSKLIVEYVDLGFLVPYFPVQVLKIVPYPPEPDGFRISAHIPDYLGGPYGPFLGIRLMISEGELSDTVVDTDEDGLSPVIFVSGASNGATITAIAPPLSPPPVPYLRSIGYSIIFRCLNGVPIILADAAGGFASHQIQWGVLPVELSSFTSIINQGNVTLNWITTSETNNSEFQVERKSDGTWETIAYVEGHGTTSTPKTYQFIDRYLQSGKYAYRLKQIDYNGNFEYHNLSNEVVIGIPVKFELKQNYPNPFNPKTRIEYIIPYNGIVTLIVYDINGREISSLVKESKQAGYYSVDFDGSNLSSGIYYYRLSTGNYKVTKRMMLIK